MKIGIKVVYAREFAKLNENFEKYASSRLWYQREEDEAVVDISFLEPNEVNTLHEFIIEKYNKGTDPSLNGALQILSVYKKIIAEPDKVAPTNLRDLAPALKAYIAKHSNSRLLFKVDGSDTRLPYLVVGIDYKEAQPMSGGGVSPAYTNINLKYIYLDEVRDKSIMFYDQHLRATDENGEITKKAGKKTIDVLLQIMGFIVGTSELCEFYNEELKIFFKYRDLIGEQFISNGYGRSFDRYDRDHPVAMNTDGSAHKLVVNEPSSRKSKGDDYVSAGFWDKNKDAVHKIPVHPYIRVFNLKDHVGYSIHTSTLTPYVYKPELIHKLVLPKEVKELIEILGNGTKEGLGDIISGKAEGIIIGCVGAPGLGKSLSAEIYSEFLARPLYTVQCSQLGIKPDDLEKKLIEVLERASRWKAVLLLDEADVYIRARGSDLLQNAIVGVFLRVLEYYRGIIFMTSNVLNLDDAIESRFSAKIIYQSPDTESAKQIWRDQMVNHGWPIDESFIDSMVALKPQLSGRSIRSLMKLSTLLARYRKTKLTLEILQHASKFTVHENELSKFVPDAKSGGI